MREMTSSVRLMRESEQTSTQLRLFQFHQHTVAVLWVKEHDGLSMSSNFRLLTKSSYLVRSNIFQCLPYVADLPRWKPVLHCRKRKPVTRDHSTMWSTRSKGKHPTRGVPFFPQLSFQPNTSKSFLGLDLCAQWVCFSLPRRELHRSDQEVLNLWPQTGNILHLQLGATQLVPEIILQVPPESSMLMNLHQERD